MADRQSQPHPFAGKLTLLIALASQSQLFAVHARTGVAHAYAQLAARCLYFCLYFGVEADFACRGELHRVAEEVIQHLPQALRVGHHVQVFSGQRQSDFQVPVPDHRRKELLQGFKFAAQ